MSKEVKINYNNTFATQHSRDYYRGASFHWSGEWMVGAHYLSDDYNIDYVVHGQVLLACAKSHLSTLENEPKDFIKDESGTVIGVVSTYWDFVLSGIVGKSPGIKIQDNYWYICKDTGVPEEEQVWENTGVKAKMELSDLTPEEIEILQRPGKEVVTEFINNTMTQSTGDDPEKIMSQKATTDALNTKASKSELSAAVENEVLRANEAYQPKGDYATNTKVDNLQDEVDDFEDAVDEAFGAVSEALDTLQDNIDDVADSIPTKVSELENDSRYQTKTDLDNALNPIKDVIPAEATVGNKLADKNFVTVSIETAKAAFKGVSASGLTEEQFLAWANGLTTNENDYVFWNTVDSNNNAILKRYVRSDSPWVYEYTLSNNSFSTSEWNAIQSGITSELVSKLTNIEAGAQVNILEGVQVSGIDLAITNKKVNVDLTPITNVIPTQASSSNQLADKNFVNSSIATSTATFQGTSAAGLTQAQFEAWLETLTTADDNDYVYWNTVDSVGNVVFKRYKYNGTAWVYEYDLNNSSFTSTEWAAIQSGVTAELVTKLVALPTNADLTAALNNKVDKVTGKQLSTEDYTTEEKTKLGRVTTILTGIQPDAEAWTGPSPGEATTHVYIYGINSETGALTTIDLVNYLVPKDSRTNYTAEEKQKLAGIEASAQVNKLEGVQVNGTDLTITNKKVNVTVPTKTSQLTNDDNVVKDASYVHTDNNYTAAEKTKLSGIEEGAQVNKIEHITLDGTEQTIGSKTVNLPAYPTTLPASDVHEWAKASTKPSYNLSEIGNADDVKAIENLSGTSGFLKKTAANSWSLDTNTYVTARDLSEADLLTRINTLAYGIQWNKNSSTCTRIGNPLLHRTLPIQSQMKGCVEKNGEPVYWLDPSNWAYKANGDPSVLDGTDGYVRDYIPRFYGKSWDTEDYGRVMISTIKIDDTWVEIPEHFEDAYESALDRTNLKLCSVVNTSAQYRGGTNSSTYDSYEAMRSLLGKPATNFSRANARTYASNAGSELLNYNIYKWVFLWLPVIEYANFDLQTAINNNLTAEGYHQGGLGNGASTFGPWLAYNGDNPIIPCGLTNSLGNFSGQVGIDYSAFDSYSAGTVYANRYRGLECPFGGVWTNLDGIIVDANRSDYDLVYTCDDPSKYSDSITSAYTNTSRSIHTDGYVKEFDLGSTGEITAISVGGGKADYHYTGSVDSTLRTVRAGGHANHGGHAGPGYLSSSYGVSGSHACIGFRTIKRIY